MAEKVEIEIEVMSTGSEAIQKVNNDLANLGKNTNDTQAMTNKQSTAMQIFNTNLLKTIPNLQTFTPIMGALGLSSFFAAGVLGGLAIASLEFSSSVDQLITGTTGLNLITQQYTGQNQTLAATFTEVDKISQTMHESYTDIEKSLSILILATRDQATAEGLLADAEKISLHTGMSLYEATKLIIDAFTGSKPVFDENKKQLQGMAAVQKLVTNATENQSDAVAAMSEYQKMANIQLDAGKTALGLLGKNLLYLIESPLVALTLIEDNVMKLGDLFSWLGTQMHNALDWVSDRLQGIWSWLQNLASSIGNLFSKAGSFVSSAFTGPSGSIEGYANGGPILGPTLLTSLSTGMPYAVAGEAGPEYVSPSRGGGGITYVFNIAGSVWSERELTNTIMQNLDTRVRLKGGY